MFERTVGVPEASRLLKHGGVVYRRYPNGCVYCYNGDKYAPVYTNPRNIPVGAKMTEDWAIGDFKPYSQLRDISMDVGTWFTR